MHRSVFEQLWTEFIKNRKCDKATDLHAATEDAVVAATSIKQPDYEEEPNAQHSHQGFFFL